MKRPSFKFGYDSRPTWQDEGIQLSLLTLACGIVIGATTALLVKSTVPDTNGKKVLEDVKAMFLEEGNIEGSWIELDTVETERFGQSTDVYYGGVSRYENDELVQYEFIADAKSGTLLDLYMI